MNKFFKCTVLVLSFALSSQAIAQEQPVYTADNCLEGQDLSAADVDISDCPKVPAYPDSAPVNMGEGQTRTAGLGQWELEKTAEGATYVYGGLNDPDESPRTFSKSEAADDVNIECWAKGYYRLRAILQNPPASYVKLSSQRDENGNRILGRFFQYQVDKRVGATGFAKGVRSYGDGLVKWVTIIKPTGENDQDGNPIYTCDQTTYEEFDEYAKRELNRRGID